MEVVVNFKSRPDYAQGYTPGSPNLIGGWGVLRAGLGVPKKRHLLFSP